MPDLLRKPWLMARLTNPVRWLTIWPWIFAGSAYWATPNHPGWAPLIAHERVHLQRQSDYLRPIPTRFLRTLAWLIAYLVSARFRLQEEALAIAAEMDAAPDITSARRMFDAYCLELAGADYHRAARSVAAAAEAIRQATRNHSYLAQVASGVFRG